MIWIKAEGRRRRYNGATLLTLPTKAMSDKRPNWIVIVDSLRAKILADHGAIDRTYPVFGGEFTNPPTLGYTVDIRANPRDEARRHYLRNIAAFVGEAAAESRFARLIVIASPMLIGELQAVFDGLGTDGAPTAEIRFVATDEDRRVGN